MAVLVLLGNIGVGRIVHQCLMTGTTVSLVGISASSDSLRSCKMHHKVVKTATPDTPTFVAKSCCTDTALYEKIEVLSALQSALVKSFDTLAYSWVPEDFYAWIALTKIDWEALYWIPQLIDLTPPLQGRTILVLVQSFLI